MSVLGELLAPRSIALVGASEGSLWSQNLVANVRGLGYSGRLHLVNPRRTRLFGRRCHPSLEEVTGEVDCAYVVAGTGSAAEVIEQCGRKGVRGVVMVTSGFAEAGPAGAALEARLARRCRELGIALLGPNCLGFVNYRRRVPAYGLLLAPPLLAGPTAIVSQSGAMLLHLHRMAQQRAIGLSHLVSIGNEAMHGAVDFLAELLADPEVRVVGALLEGFRDPAGFLNVARRALEAGKPLVVLKVGRSQAAARSVSAHTGSLAGEEAVAGAVLRQAGVLRVEGLEELLETCALLAARGWPRGGRTAVVTTSGGACGIVSDLAEGTGIELPDFPAATKRRLAALLPTFGTPQNPLDTTGVIVDQPSLLADCIDAVVAGGGYEALLVNADPPREPGPVPEKVEARMAALAASLERAPIFAAATSTVAGDLTPYGGEVLGRHRLHVCNGLTLGVRALAHAIGYSRAQSRQRPVRDPGPRPPPPLVAGWTGIVSEVDGKRLLEAYGIPIPDEWLAGSASEAVAAAREIGFPVVLKAQSPDLPHKTEAGAVLLDLRSEAAVAAGFTSVSDAALRHAPGARLDGVLVSRQVFPVAELIAGVHVDPDFGPVVLAGMGGVFAEALADTSLRLPPLDQEEAAEMLGELRSAALLRGARGLPPGDLAAAAAALVRLGELALDLGGRLRSLDVNPLFVMAQGEGVLAGDALLVLG